MSNRYLTTFLIIPIQNTTQKPKEEVEPIQCSKDNRQNTTQKPKEEVEPIQCSKNKTLHRNLKQQV
jgi:hypothetical protein